MGATRYFNSIISADSHVMEPYDLWWNAIGSQYGDRTPRVLDEHNGRKGSYFYSGYQGAPVSAIRELRVTAEAAAVEARDMGLGEGGYLPEVRVKFQEMAAIRAEVLNPTQMLLVLRNPDVEVLQACSKVFNDWEAEFVSMTPPGLSESV